MQINGAPIIMGPWSQAWRKMDLVFFFCTTMSQSAEERWILPLGPLRHQTRQNLFLPPHSPRSGIATVVVPFVKQRLRQCDPEVTLRVTLITQCIPVQHWSLFCFVLYSPTSHAMWKGFKDHLFSLCNTCCWVSLWPRRSAAALEHNTAVYHYLDFYSFTMSFYFQFVLFFVKR